MTTMPADQETLFVTEDEQAVYELGEEEGAGTYAVGSLIVTDATLRRVRGRWEVRGTIAVRVRG